MNTDGHGFFAKPQGLKIRYHPKNLASHFSQRNLTGVPMPGRMLLVIAVNGTRLRFSAAVKSSFTWLLPHFGQMPENNLTFGGRFVFLGRGMLSTTRAQTHGDCNIKLIAV